MRHCLILIVFALLSLQVFEIAADDTVCLNKMHNEQYEYQINSGYMNYASLDDLFSNNVYSGGNLFYEAAFGIRRNIFIQTSAKFSIFDRKPKSLTLYPSIISSDSRFNIINHLHFELDNTYRFQVLKDRFNNLNLYISGSWFTSGDYVLNDYMNPELLLSSIAPGFYGEWYFKPLLSYIQISSLWVTYTCRNNYTVSRGLGYKEFGPLEFLKQNSRIQFPNSLCAIFLNYGCKINVSKRFGTQLEYHFRYLNDSEPRILTSLTSIYSVGLFYRISK
jgi:hypothetical protein